MVLGQQRSGKSDADAIAYADKNIDKYAPVSYTHLVALTRARKQMFMTGVPQLLKLNPIYA